MSIQAKNVLRASGAMAALVFLALPQVALAQGSNRSGVYLQVGIGALVLQDNDYTGSAGRVTGSYDLGPYGTVALGYRVSPNFRVEVELGAATTTYSLAGTSGDDRFGLFSGFISGYLDLPVSAGVTPYFGIGLGAAASTARDLGTNSGFAVFGEAGVSIAVGTNWDVVPSIRYAWFDASDRLAEADAAWLPRIAVRYSF